MSTCLARFDRGNATKRDAPPGPVASFQRTPAGSRGRQQAPHAQSHPRAQRMTQRGSPLAARCNSCAVVVPRSSFAAAVLRGLLQKLHETYQMCVNPGTLISPIILLITGGGECLNIHKNRSAHVVAQVGPCNCAVSLVEEGVNGEWGWEETEK